MSDITLACDFTGILLPRFSIVVTLVDFTAAAQNNNNRRSIDGCPHAGHLRVILADMIETLVAGTAHNANPSADSCGMHN